METGLENGECDGGIVVGAGQAGLGFAAIGASLRIAGRAFRGEDLDGQYRYISP